MGARKNNRRVSRSSKASGGSSQEIDYENQPIDHETLAEIGIYFDENEVFEGGYLTNEWFVKEGIFPVPEWAKKPPKPKKGQKELFDV